MVRNSMVTKKIVMKEILYTFKVQTDAAVNPIDHFVATRNYSFINNE